METITKLKEIVLRKQEAQLKCDEYIWTTLKNKDWLENNIIIKKCQEQIDKIILEA